MLSEVRDLNLAQLAMQLVPRRYLAGQAVFEQGDPGTSLHIIESGEVKITIRSVEGEELLVAMLRQGDFFGELALLDGHSRTATATAETDLSTLSLSRDDFLTFLRGSAEAAVAVAEALARRLRESDERLSENVFLDLPQRLARCLVRLAETSGQKSPDGVSLDIELSHGELAALVDADSDRVDEVFSQWEEAGLLRREGRSFILPDPERLARGA